jgi:hypothetical protein
MYKVEKPEGAPSWFTPGIVCRVWDSDKELGYDRPVIWYSHSHFCFMASNGSWFKHAEPIESWEPVKGEWVAAWDEDWEVFCIVKYEKLYYDGKRFRLSAGVYDHIARITDGLDLRCTPEQLKERTEWK